MWSVAVLMCILSPPQVEWRKYQEREPLSLLLREAKDGALLQELSAVTGNVPLLLSGFINVSPLVVELPVAFCAGMARLERRKQCRQHCPCSTITTGVR